jgi:hypothetical protein
MLFKKEIPVRFEVSWREDDVEVGDGGVVCRGLSAVCIFVGR